MNGKNHICSFVVVIFLLVLYIFNIVPQGLPTIFGTREYLSILSCFIIFPQYHRNKIYRGIIFANWTQFLFSIITILVNGTTDFWYVQFGLRNILYINGALLIVSLLPKKKSIDSFVILILLAICINSIIATVCFVVPSAMNVLVSFQQIADPDKIDKTIMWSVRMLGLGCGNFFVGGIINGIGIILTFWLMTRNKINGILGLFIIAFLLIVGVFIARTTIVGLIVGLLLFARSTSVRNIVLLFCGGVFLILVIQSSDLFSTVDASHAFEFFSTDIESQRSSQTMESLSEMYHVKFDIVTLLIGDGLSKTPTGEYYMNTDVGYLRNILYFGLFGTIFGYFYYELYILKKLYKQDKTLKYFVLSMGLFLVLLNFKGLPDFNFMVFLLLAFYIVRRKEFKNENIACY